MGRATERIMVGISTEMKERLVELAEERKLSMSAYVRILLDSHIKRKDRNAD